MGLGKPKAPEERSSAHEGDDKVNSCEEPGDGVLCGGDFVLQQLHYEPLVLCFKQRVAATLLQVDQ